jgi:hypothetical protein
MLSIVSRAYPTRSTKLILTSTAAFLALIAFYFGMRGSLHFRFTSLSSHPLGLSQNIFQTAKMVPLSTEEILTLDASELANLLAKGRITSVSLVEQLLHQISREDKARMNLRAVLSVAPRDILMKTASKLDDERTQGKLRGPLHGIPILVKVRIMSFLFCGTKLMIGRTQSTHIQTWACPQQEGVSPY